MTTVRTGKTCTKCRQDKPYTAFYKAKAECKACLKIRNAACYKANQPARSAQKKAARLIKPRQLKDGVTLVVPTRATPEACECCGMPERVYSRRLALDHNHNSGAFRGWLCLRCNSGIGLLGDSLTGVLAAVKYLLDKDAAA